MRGRLKKLSLATLGLSALVCVGIHPASAVTMGEVDGWCQDRGDEGKMNLCNAYLDEIMRALASDDNAVNETGVRVCYPRDEPLTPIADKLHAYLSQHPTARSGRIVETAAQVLRGQYPCK